MQPHQLYYDLEEAASHLHYQPRSQAKYDFPAPYSGTTDPYFVARAVATDLVPLLIKDGRLSLNKMPNDVLSLDQDNTSSTPTLPPTQTTVDRPSAYALPSVSFTAAPPPLHSPHPRCTF
jgi:hypothetical protein